MKVKDFTLPGEARPDFPSPFVSAVHVNKRGGLEVATAFLKANLWALEDGSFSDLKVNDAVGGDVWAIPYGLRQSVSGDTVFVTWQPGVVPGFLRGLTGLSIKGRSGEALVEWLRKQSGGFVGAALRHSVVQWTEGEMLVRRSKEPGLLWDVAHIGDFVFGLSSETIWREPYLNAEKREVLRSDLGRNDQLHRSDDGLFWLLGGQGRLLRLDLTDIKAKPTPLKPPGAAGFYHSAASHTDGWLYASCGEGAATLVRVRRNPVTLEEEIQTVVEKLPGRITSIAALEPAEEGARRQIVVALETGAGDAEVHALELVAPEDPELLPPAPALKRVGTLPGVRSVNALTPDGSGQVLWAGEGRLGWQPSGDAAAGRLKVLRLEF